MVRSRVQNDASVLALQYNHIREKVNVTDVSAFTNVSMD
jgi:hypothetical protein